MNIHQDLKDVKIWQVLIDACTSLYWLVEFFITVSFLIVSYQVHTLLKGLEKIAASADIPMLVCGDFNSVPGRYVMCLTILN